MLQMDLCSQGVSSLMLWMDLCSQGVSSLMLWIDASWSKYPIQGLNSWSSLSVAVWYLLQACLQSREALLPPLSYTCVHVCDWLLSH